MVKVTNVDEEGTVTLSRAAGGPSIVLTATLADSVDGELCYRLP